MVEKGTATGMGYGKSFFRQFAHSIFQPVQPQGKYAFIPCPDSAVGAGVMPSGSLQE